MMVYRKLRAENGRFSVEMLRQPKLEQSILTMIMSTYMINENVYPHNPLQQVNI